METNQQQIERLLTEIKELKTKNAELELTHKTNFNTQNKE